MEGHTETRQALTGIHGRGSILRALEGESIPAQVVVGSGGRIRVLTREWSDYWRPVYETGKVALRRSLEALREAWRDYIHSDFDAALRREYCLSYFLLLDAVGRDAQAFPVLGGPLQALHTTLAFECFGIAAVDSPGEPVAAATSTFRNPCYLLAKLRSPEVADDSRFLPLITVAGTNDSHIFYHYRQHRLAADSEHSVLVYLDASPRRRLHSFRVVNAVERSLGQGRDPRAAERAKRISDRILVPYLSARASDGQPLDFEVVDLGAGSGLLAARICREVDRFLNRTGIAHKFRAWMVDLVPPLPARFFSRGSLRRGTDSLASVGVEYRRWLAGNERLPVRRGIRIALVSYLFNNASEFQILPVAPEAIAPHLQQPATDVFWADCLPSTCLKQGGLGPEMLRVAAGRAWLNGGRVYLQPSLSRFYRGLYVLSRSARSDDGSSSTERSIFLPLRRFRPECLYAEDGRNVLLRLLGECSLVLVEDADLGPRELAAHAETMQSAGTAAVDTTKTLGLRKRYSYVFLHSTDGALESIRGRRLW